MKFDYQTVGTIFGAWRGLISRLHKKGKLDTPLTVKEREPWDYKAQSGPEEENL